VNLVLTSPPFALHFKKEYGNANQGTYVRWFLAFAREFKRLIRDDGRLCKEVGLYLAQEFYWFNPGKIPAPAEWVNVRKIRVKDAVNCVWWLSKTPYPKANNQMVLQDYSPDMKRLLRRGYRSTIRPSGHVITKKFKDNGGAIPSNIFICGNNDANGPYMELCKERGIKPHPARFPIQMPMFFLRFLTAERSCSRSICRKQHYWKGVRGRGSKVDRR
jgi:site-specific DNA-methyltransferase (cytosine-N4-specific)